MQLVVVDTTNSRSSDGKGSLLHKACLLSVAVIIAWICLKLQYVSNLPIFTILDQCFNMQSLSMENIILNKNFYVAVIIAWICLKLQLFQILLYFELWKKLDLSAKNPAFSYCVQYLEFSCMLVFYSSKATLCETGNSYHKI